MNDLLDELGPLFRRRLPLSERESTGPAKPSATPYRIIACSSPAAVQRQQLAEALVVGDVCGPTARGSRSGVKRYVRIDELHARLRTPAEYR